jgi:hypothetical protein
MSIQPPSPKPKPTNPTWQELVRQLGQETNPKRTVQLARELCRIMDAEREKQKQSLLFQPRKV